MVSNLIANGKQNMRIYEGNQNSSFVNEKMNWFIHVQYTRNEIDECQELIKGCIDKKFENEFLFYKQGIIYQERGQYQQALESFQMALKLNPDGLDNYIQIGNCLYELKMYKLALEAYDKANKMSKFPNWKIFHKIGECLLNLEDFEKAKQHIQEAANIGKNEISYKLLLKILKTEKDHKSAIAVCRLANENCPNNIDFLCEAGLLSLILNEKQQAFEKLSNALAQKPNCSKALYGFGYITQCYGDYDVALLKYKSALHMNTNSLGLWNNIATCYFAKQKYIAAVSCLKKAHWISPLNPHVLYNLGQVYLSINQPASAFNYFCAAVNLCPNNYVYFSSMAYALLELNDPTNAIRALKQALLLSPNDLRICLNMTLCYLICKQEGGFQEYLEICKNLIESEDNIPSECKALFEYFTHILSKKEENRPTSQTKELTLKTSNEENSETA